jgi:hypothetical protein
LVCLRLAAVCDACSLAVSRHSRLLRRVLGFVYYSPKLPARNWELV